MVVWMIAYLIGIWVYFFLLEAIFYEPDLGDAYELYRRGLISEEEYIEFVRWYSEQWMKKHGYLRRTPKTLYTLET